MPEPAPVSVEVDLRAGIIDPKALWLSGRRIAIAAQVRQWDKGKLRYYDLLAKDGRSILLCLDRLTGQWYQIDIRGPGRPA
jgi:hypothetical protein